MNYAWNQIENIAYRGAIVTARDMRCRGCQRLGRMTLRNKTILRFYLTSDIGTARDFGGPFGRLMREFAPYAECTENQSFEGVKI
jgi:hypothetical protein